MEEKHTYVIKCLDCGVVLTNKSAHYCDRCGNIIEAIRLGDTWYNADELDKDNLYN